LIFSLYEHPEGVDVPDGNLVAYDVMRNTAMPGPVWIEGHALVWDLGEHVHAEPKLQVAVDLDPGTEWLVRCDRVDFPPAAVAYLHTHPGPGIRCLLHGALRIDRPDAESETIEPFGAWFEGADYPVLASASPAGETAFVRVMLLPREWEGKRTIRYVNPEDEEKPAPQRATVFLERLLGP
jgi:hypothetical protein